MEIYAGRYTPGSCVDGDGETERLLSEPNWLTGDDAMSVDADRDGGETGDGSWENK